MTEHPNNWIDDSIRNAHTEQLGALHERVRNLIDVMNEDLDEVDAQVSILDMLDWLGILGYTLVPSDDNIAFSTYHAYLKTRTLPNEAP